MHIDAYSFGKIVIDGTSHASDVIVYPGRVDAKWWRKEGHLLQLADLEGVLRARPEVLVIGTGYFGVMQVPGPLVEDLRRQGIEVVVERTARAVAEFNTLQGGRTVIAALHITC